MEILLRSEADLKERRSSLGRGFLGYVIDDVICESTNELRLSPLVLNMCYIKCYAVDNLPQLFEKFQNSKMFGV
jgi:hypothetical protein